MTDRERWGLREPVHTCRIERTWYLRKCGADACETEERGDVAALEFRTDGFLAHRRHRNPDGSEWTMTNDYNDLGRLTCARNENGTGLMNRSFYEYGDAGRLVRVRESDHVLESFEYDAEGRKSKTVLVETQGTPMHRMWGVEGSDSTYSAEGAVKVITRYNQRDQPAELLFHDQSDQLLSRVDFRYDQDGHLVEEAQSDVAGAMLSEMAATMTEAQLKAVQTLFGQQLHQQLHQYDQHGRRVSTRRRIGKVSDETTTRSYNDHGDEIEVITENTERSYDLDDEGRIPDTPTEERTARSESVFRYDYDARGNWIMKAVESRAGELFSVEHRTITYFQ